MATATDIVNQALQLMGGNQPPVTGVAPAFDTSVAGVAAAALYYPSVPDGGAPVSSGDFTRATVDLVKTGNAAPFPWSQEYAYPPNAVQVWAGRAERRNPSRSTRCPPSMRSPPPR